MAQIGETVTVKPGHRAPVSGYDDCDTGCGHRRSTDVHGHRMPPLPDGYRGGTWRPSERRPTS